MRYFRSVLSPGVSEQYTFSVVYRSTCSAQTRLYDLRSRHVFAYSDVLSFYKEENRFYLQHSTALSQVLDALRVYKQAKGLVYYHIPLPRYKLADLLHSSGDA
jgi:hypothetical protein